MWRERIIETKKAKGLTAKMMAESSSPHIPADTITHILTAKTDDPRISTVLALGASVGLSPWELFADPAALVAYQSYLTLQAEVDALKAEKEAIVAEKEALIAENAALKNKVESLRDKVDSLKDEIIDIHKFYMKGSQP